MNLFIILNLVDLVVGTVAGVWFVALYTRRAPWWREQHRAHLFTFSAIVTAFYALYLGRTIADPTTGPGAAMSTFNLVRFALFTIMTGAIVWRLVLLIRSKPRAADVH